MECMFSSENSPDGDTVSTAYEFPKDILNIWGTDRITDFQIF